MRAHYIYIKYVVVCGRVFYGFLLNGFILGTTARTRTGLEEEDKSHELRALLARPRHATPHPQQLSAVTRQRIPLKTKSNSKFSLSSGCRRKGIIEIIFMNTFTTIGKDK
jgi:hypothetical protein